MAHIQWRIGCSGFYYKEWKETFYPKGLPQNRWFEYYCQHFNTLEINNTFYRFPQLTNLESWYRKSPPGFSFAVKVPQTITHQQKFVGSSDLLRQFYDIVLSGLQDKLGCILFQLPPRMQYTEERLHTIVQLLDPTQKNIIEFRHISWWRREVIEALEKNCITFCGVSYPGLIDEPIVNNPVAYYRFHGVPHLYHSPYEKSFLQQITRKIAAHPQTQTAYLFFNNTASGAALNNARQVQEMIAEIV